MRGRQAGYTVSARTDHPAKRLFLYEAIIMGVTTGTAEEFCVSIQNVRLVSVGVAPKYRAERRKIVS